jgi:hypothetical protein
MEKIKEVLEGVEVDSSGEEEKPASRVDSRASVPIPAPVQRSLPTPPQQPIKAAPSSSSSRSRGSRNSSLSDLHADDIIKQLTMNAD